MENPRGAEVCFSSNDIAGDVAFFTERLGFRLENIFPADNPAMATISGKGMRIRLERATDSAATGVLRLTLSAAEHAGLGIGLSQLASPGGARVVIVDAEQSVRAPPTQHEFVVTRRGDDGGWVKGRAGMLYRDLIPSRLGGAVIASHIRIPEAGPVPDLVHFHDVEFQLIFCHRGWVRLAYEDQGPPFVLEAGGCVLQPPQIRHRVLEASANLEVVEVTTPAEHLTSMDHEMTLPTPFFRPEREFDGQRFLRSDAEGAVWGPWRLPGFEARDTGVAKATRGKASVCVVRPARPTRAAGDDVSEPPVQHAAGILFGFVLEGRMTLRTVDQGSHMVGQEDAFVIPPGMSPAFEGCSADLQLLEVAQLPSLGRQG
jgi:quercetin dioxygenase-like cupin family protein